MDTTILQIPVEKSLRDEALIAFQKMGFSSLQDAVRLYLHKAVKGVIDFQLVDTVQLSPRAIKRYNKLFNNIDSGKETLYEAKDVDDLMRHLHED